MNIQILNGTGGYFKMNELGYKLIVDKQVKRRIDIINALLYSQKPIKIRNLAKICNASSKTISSELEKMNAILPKSSEICYKELEGVQLISENPFLISEFINEQLDGNPLYFVVESIFNNVKLTLEDYAFEMYISNSTMNNYLAILKKILKEDFALNLQTSPYIDIVGGETNIRFFFFQYFRHAHDNAAISPRDDQYAAVYNVILHADMQYDLHLNVDYYRLSQWAIIFEQRVRFGHFVTIDDSVLEKHIGTNSYKRLRDSFKESFKTNPILNDIPEKEFLYVYLTKLDGVIYEKGEAIYSKDYLPLLSTFETISNSFFQEKHLDLFKHGDLKLITQAFLANNMLLSDASILFQKANSPLKDYARKYYPQFLNSWISILDNQLKKVFPKAHFIEDIATNLTLICIGYLRLHELEHKNILFSLTGTPASLIYYKAMLLNIIPNGITPYFIFNKPLTDSLLDALDIDLCIYNYKLDIKLNKAECIRLSNVPTEAEWIQLLPKLLSL